jgi:hypothetical protein
MLVTADDVEQFVALYEGEYPKLKSPRLKEAEAVKLFDLLVESIQPRLVVTEPGGAMDWIEAVMRARAAIAEGSRGAARTHLKEVVELARRYGNISGPQPQRILNFILNAGLRRVAEEDWSRAVGAAQREEAKTTAVAAGSVVEAIALDILERLSPDDAEKLRVHLNGLEQDRRRNLHQPAKPTLAKWQFAVLILALGSQGLKVLSDRTHDIGQLLRDWRNCVHPSKYRSVPPLSSADGRLAIAFAEKVIEEVTLWHAAGGKPVVP